MLPLLVHRELKLIVNNRYMQMHEDYQKIILMTPPGIKGYELSMRNGGLDGRTNQGLYPACGTAGFTSETVRRMAKSVSTASTE